MRRMAFVLTLAAALAASACGGGDDEDESEGAATAGCEEVEAPDPKPVGTRKAPTEPLDAGKTYRLAVETNCGTFTIEQVRAGDDGEYGRARPRLLLRRHDHSSSRARLRDPGR
jgi:hypothetical protein